MSEKIFVLDTNVLLADPNAIYMFEGNEVIIPSTVLQELDSKKKLMDEVGKNARYTSRQLDKLRETGKLHKGVQLVNGGTLKVLAPPKESDAYDSFIDDSVDTSIVALAKFLKDTETDKDVVLVSRDVNVRIKADMFVNAEDYQNDKVITAKDDKYLGFTEVEVDHEDIDMFYKERRLYINQKFEENHYVILKCGKQSALTRFNGGYLHPLYNYDDKDKNVFGIQAKNVHQIMALDLLLDENIPLVTISAKAGTGKTLLALAAGLSQTQDFSIYNKVIAARPFVVIGKDLGALPGELEEKLAPIMQPIYDNLQFLFSCKDDEELKSLLSGYEQLIQVEALTYIRGRSIPNQFFIVDEAQNLTKHEVKTILTRVGEGTKIVLIGDPDQIDSPYLDAYSNGLTYVIEKFKEQKMSGHMTLMKGERSPLAQLAADIL